MWSRKKVKKVQTEEATPGKCKKIQAQKYGWNKKYKSWGGNTWQIQRLHVPFSAHSWNGPVLPCGQNMAILILEKHKNTKTKYAIANTLAQKSQIKNQSLFSSWFSVIIIIIFIDHPLIILIMTITIMWEGGTSCELRSGCRPLSVVV